MKKENSEKCEDYRKQKKSKSICSSVPLLYNNSGRAQKMNSAELILKLSEATGTKCKILIFIFLANYKERKSIVTEFKGLKIFTSVKNKIHIDIEQSFSRDSFEFYENILQHEFFPVLITKKLIYLFYKNDNVHFFSKKMNFLFKINIKGIKKISISGRFSLIIKLFNNDENKNINALQNFMIKFFSTSQREYLLEKILPYSTNTSYHNFEKFTIIDICKDSLSFFDHLCLNFSNKLKKSGHFYYSEIYQIFDLKRNYDFKVFLILSETGIIQKTFKNIFYNIENIWFDEEDLGEMYEEILSSVKRHRDSIKIDRRGRKKKLDSASDNDIKEIKTNALSEEEKKLFSQFSNNKRNDSIDSNNAIEDESYNLRPRHLMALKKSKSICEKNLLRYGSFSYNDDLVLSKPVYDKISFNVMILRYLGKEPKVLEVNNSGFFVIYKKGKSDSFISYLIQDIVSMEGEPSTNYLNITTLFKDTKKTLFIEFSNSYEKYILKTIIYNNLILSNPRYKAGSQLKLNVNIITWNVAGIDVPSDLGIMFNSHSLHNIDIFTIGVQECSIFKIKDWMKHLKTLISYYGFCEVTSIEMCQMFIIVFIKNDLRIFVESVESSYKPMGFANVIGNKGGIVINFKLLGYQLTFVNCHLAPKPYKVLERNKNVKTLVKTIRIGEKFADFDVLADYVFWQGDLNYRVDYNFDETVAEIKKKNITHLLAKDQLIKLKQQNQVFYNFQEPEINFYPTYRRIKGTDEYSNKKNQSPSWCDRIMVKTNRNLDIHYYDAIKTIRHSDHLPVLGKFSIYLTIPSFEDVDKLLYQNLNAKFIYDNIQVAYDFTEAFSELEIEPKFPFKMKLTGHYFINKQVAESKTIEIKDIRGMENLQFDEIFLSCPPQFVFDLPHARALNFFFVLNIVVGKTSYDIGYAKYSLENVEKENLNLLKQKNKIDIYWRTRKFGTLSFNASYKF